MKILLSKILYYCGNLASIPMNWGRLAYIFYPIYRKLMLWSCTLDKNGKVWKVIKKRKLHD